MDCPRIITLKFIPPGEQKNAPVSERVVKAKYVLKYIPDSCLGALMADPDITIDGLTITDYSAEEWDACVLASKGKLPTYLSGDRLRELYQRYFGGKPTDVLWFDNKKSCSVTCEAMLDLLTKPSASVFVAPDQKTYSLFKPLCAPSLSRQSDGGVIVPFQLITLNGNFFTVCFDHGVPLLSDANNVFSTHIEGTSLYEDRDMALGTLRAHGLHRYIYNEKYGEEHAILVEEYGAPEKSVGATYYGGDINTRSAPGRSAGANAGNVGTRGATGPVGPPIPPTCGDHCILVDPNITEKCRCFAYAGQCLGPGGRDHYLESLISLSSLDEVAFITGMARAIFFERRAKFVDLVPNVPNPHSNEQYQRAYELLKTCTLQPECSIHTAIVSSRGLLMQVFLGFVRLQG